MFENNEIRTRFSVIAGLEDKHIILEEAALVIAAEFESSIDIDYALLCLDKLALKFEASSRNNTQLGVSVSSISHYIHQTEGFTGNHHDYYDPKNSYLNRVIESRQGIPITLALIHIALGTRLKVNVVGLNFPGRFLVKYGEDTSTIVDPFTGRILSRSDCGNLLKQLVGPTAQIRNEYFETASNKSILLRILDNLKQIFWQSKSWSKSKSCVEQQILLVPENESLQIQLGVIYEMQGEFIEAKDRYVKLLQSTQNVEVKALASKRLLTMPDESLVRH